MTLLAPSPLLRKCASLLRRAGFILFTVFLLSIGSLEATTFFYTFGGEDGGVAQLDVDEATGAVKSHRVIADSGLYLPKKLVVNADRTRLLVTSDGSKKAWLFKLGDTPEQIAEIDLQEKASDLRVHGTHAIVAASKGIFHWIRMEDGRIEQTWSARKSLTPSGRKGESILLLPEKDLALISFQKDSEKGEHRGSRMLVFDLKTFTARHDLQLPRATSLIYTLQIIRKNRGPIPKWSLLGKRPIRSSSPSICTEPLRWPITMPRSLACGKILPTKPLLSTESEAPPFLTGLK